MIACENCGIEEDTVYIKHIDIQLCKECAKYIPHPC